MSVPKKLIQKIKIKFLTTKFILLALFLLLTTSVFGYEAVKLHQFNKHIIQAKEEKESEDYQKAFEAFQKAKDVLGATFFLKSFKKEELEEIDNGIEEIKKLAEKEEKVKGVTTNDSPTATPSPMSVPTTTIKNDNNENAVNETERLKEKVRKMIEQGQQEPEVEETPICPTLSDKYATIISLEDSKGNVKKQSEHNECLPSHGEFTVRNGETITVSISVDNKKSDPVLYEFIGSGFPNKWQSSNSTTAIIDDRYESVHLRVFVKNSDDKFRAPDYDDMIQVSYKVVD